jgi:hypothetical protein
MIDRQPERRSTYVLITMLLVIPVCVIVALVAMRWLEVGGL